VCGVSSPSDGCCLIKCGLQSPKYLPNPLRKKVGLATGNSTVLREELPGEPLRSCHVGHRSPHERVVKIRHYLLFQQTQHYVASLPLQPVTWLGRWVTCHLSPLSRNPRWKRTSSTIRATTLNIELCFRIEIYGSFRLDSRELFK
jgi:hypothetical protein